MNKHTWAYFCWPGLWSLWHQGAVTGFLLAFGSSLSLNLLMLSTFYYTELLPPAALNYGWLVLALVWAGCGVGSYGWHRWNHLRGPRNDQNDLLACASVEYLKGNWYQAELSLWQALKHDRRDVDALLMLATICRHTNRLDEAATKLDELLLLERSSKWQAEIERERILIARARAKFASETETTQPASNESEATEPLATPITDQSVQMDVSPSEGEQNSTHTVDNSNREAA